MRYLSAKARRLEEIIQKGQKFKQTEEDIKFYHNTEKNFVETCRNL